MRSSRSLALVPLLLACAACSQPVDDAATPDGVPPPMQPEATAPETPAATTTASVTLVPTEGSQVAGTLAFSLVDGVVRATGEVSGLAPDSEHGFHLHENGDCSAPDGSSAGGHFNPATTEHGRVGHGTHHGGDSDNIVANAEGVATVDARFEGVTLGDGAATDIVGKGVIVHADPDDYATQPTGNAGARLACGVVQAQ